jgi:hypothetical protein
MVCFTVTTVNLLATPRKNQKAMLAVGIVLLISVIVVGILASLPQTGTPNQPENHLFQYGGAAAGTFVQTADGGFAIAATSTDGNIMVLRLNASKDVEWEKAYGAGAGNALVVAADGGFVVAATKTTAEGNVSYMIKTDAQGNVEWAKDFNGTGFVSVANGNGAGYVLLGSITAEGVQYATLTSVDLTGNLQWSYNYSSSQAQTNMLNTLIGTSDGGYAATGLIQYSNSGITEQNGWFLKVNSESAIQVNRPYAYEGWTNLNGAAQTADGGYLLVGATANADTSPYAAFIIKSDYDGHPLTSQINQTLNATTTAGFELDSITKMADGNFVVSGYEQGVGVTIQKISGDGQMLAYVTFGVGGGQVGSGCVVGTDEGSYVWVGFAGESIWLNDGTPLTNTP